MRSGIKHLNEWLIVLLILIFAAFTDYLMNSGGRMFTVNSLLTYFNPSPGNLLIGIETIAAIDQFSGNAIKEVEMSLLNISVLISTILLFITGPWLLFKGYKKDEEQEESKSKPWYWFLGASLSVWSLAVIPILITSFYISEVSQKNEEAIRVSRLKDQMRTELYDVSFEAAEYAILEDGYEENFSLDQLEMEDLEFDYSSTLNASGSVLTITAIVRDKEEIRIVSDVDLSNPDFVRLRN